MLMSLSKRQPAKGGEPAKKAKYHIVLEEWEAKEVWEAIEKLPISAVGPDAMDFFTQMDALWRSQYGGNLRGEK